MNSSFYNGISGIKSQQLSIDTWGNNIANINTVAFRYSEPEFASMLSQASVPSGLQGFGDVGMGSRTQTSALSTKVGNLMTTERPFDLALAGRGFFGVAAPEGKTYYTRNGEFFVDASGYLVDNTGNKVLGQMSSTLVVDDKLNANLSADPAKVVISDPGSQKPIRIPTTMSHPGLPGTPAEVSTTTPIVYDLKQSTSGTGSTAVDPVSISYYLTADTVPTMHIKDSTGKEVLTQPMQNQGKGQHSYTWDGKVPTQVYNTDGTPMVDANGKPVTQNLFTTPGQYTVTVEYVSKVAVQAIPPGELQQYQVDTNGNIAAKFTNGLSAVIGQIPIYQFSNERGLSKEGDNHYAETSDSGKRIFYKDSKGVYMPGVEVQSNMLEGSNVSLSDAMTQLIITQKAFDANSKCITTSDQMIQRALALKNR